MWDQGMAKPPVERTSEMVEVKTMLAYFCAVAEGLIWDLESDY